MKVLWLTTDTPELYCNNGKNYNGGGWIRSLLAHFSDQYPHITIGMAFPLAEKRECKQINNVVYFPLYNPPLSRLKKLGRYWNMLSIDDYYLCKHELQEVIRSFKPDIIQVFGIEQGLASVVELTDIPVVLHLQGLIIPYLNAFFPPNFNKYTNVFYGNFFNECIIRNGLNYRKRQLEKMALYEKRRFEHSKYFMGRTEWDYQMSSLFSPNSSYYKVNECLRSIFYKDILPITKKSNNELVIISTISSTYYKGFDTILKTAKILKDDLSINYSWHIIGLNQKSSFVRMFEKQCRISSKDYSIVYKGVLDSDSLKNELMNADIFIHPSYIDNSPNSVCEAQICGLPVIAANVGGVSSLIEHKKTGLLVPANAPYDICYWIKELINNDNLRESLSNNAVFTAKERHNPQTIVKNILEVYQSILKKNNNG